MIAKAAEYELDSSIRPQLWLRRQDACSLLQSVHVVA